MNSTLKCKSLNHEAKLFNDKYETLSQLLGTLFFKKQSFISSNSGLIIIIP